MAVGVLATQGIRSGLAMDTRLRQVFNRAATEPDFEEALFKDLRKMLLENGIDEQIVCFIETHRPQNLHCLAKILEEIDYQVA